MTKRESVQIMAVLAGLYGQGKGNPEIMAEAWFMILEPYDFEVAKKAVLTYARNDTREYSSFPTAGNIVKCIEEEIRKEQAPISEIIKAVSYGWSYDQLSANAKSNITEERYNDWLRMDAEDFAYRANELAGTLRNNQKRLQG